MSSFTTPLQIEVLPEGRFKVLSAFEFYIYTSAGERVIVPEGFITDFATIPKSFRWLLPPYHSDYGKAAVIHDYLIANQYVNCPDHGIRKIESRAEARLVFKIALRVLNCPLWKQNLLVGSVGLYDSTFAKLKSF
jgi:hypothetical protein